MKKIYSFLLIGILIPATAGLVPAEEPPPAARTAAEKGLRRFLEEIPPAELINLGFPEGDVSGAEPGEPWPVYTITPDNLLSASPETSVENLVTPTGLWYFPVFCDGAARTILTVTRMDGEWEAVAIGRAPLARELEKISRQWPRTGGYSPKLIAVYQAAAYFFAVPEESSRNLTPVTFDGAGFGGYRQAAGPEYAATAELGDLLADLKKAVRTSLEEYQSARPGEDK